MVSEPRRELAALRASHRAALLVLRGFLPQDGSANGLMDTIERATEKLYDDQDAVYAFFTEPQPTSLRADAPRRVLPAENPPPPGREFRLIQGGASG